MNLQECISAIKSAQALGVCAVEQNETLANLTSVASIVASLAIIATAVFAFVQLSYLRQQIKDARQAASDQISTTKEEAKLAATLNLLIQLQTNEHWRENRLKFIKLRDDKSGLRKHANESSDETLCVRGQLNQYELIAIGIHQGILDETMYGRFYRSTIIKDWTACYEFIDLERQGNTRYWKELEELVRRLNPPAVQTS